MLFHRVFGCSHLQDLNISLHAPFSLNHAHLNCSVSQETHLPLFPGEHVLYKAFGYLREEEGLIKCWVPGIWNITSQRLILWIKTPGEVIFETPLESLRALRVPASHEVRQEMELIYPEGSARISLSDRDEFEEALARAAGETVAKRGFDLYEIGQLPDHA